MRRWFLSLFVCLALLVGVRVVFAAHAGLENTRGGAAISYWTCADGFVTLLNVQNTEERALAVHVVFYDQNSQEIMDFNVPLSGYDNWGAEVSCQNGQLVVTPQPSFYQGPNNGGEVRRAPTDATEGYVTVAITAIDGDCGAAGALVYDRCDYDGDGVVDDFDEVSINGDGRDNNADGCIDDPAENENLGCMNGDPRDEVRTANYRNRNVWLPNWIILRAAMVNYSAGNAFALNSFALVNFRNMPNNVTCLNLSNPAADLGNAPGDDNNGVRIGRCELLAFGERAYPNGGFDAVAFVVGDPTVQAGDANMFTAAPTRWNNNDNNALYWARYGENGIVETSFVMIFPAMGGRNSLDMTIFDDNEMTQSAYYVAPEVAHIALGTDIAAFESGEVFINVRYKDWNGDSIPETPGVLNNNAATPNSCNRDFAPNDNNVSCIVNYKPAFFGFSLIEGPNFVDIYPIVREGHVSCVGANAGAATSLCILYQDE